jgi:4-hydroxybenzoyl-CoA thioesterase
MARVELDLPDHFPFLTEIPIRISDINYGNHLGNDAVLSLAQEARVRWLASHGWGELDICGLGIVVADAAVIYRAEGRYGMVLKIELAWADVRSRGCDLLYRLSDVATGQEIARVKTGLIFFDYEARKVAHLPEPFRRVVAGP